MVVHLVVPATTLALLELIYRCPQLEEAIEVHPSRSERHSTPSLCLLEVRGVKIFPGAIQGHRTDMAKYFTVGEGLILQKAMELGFEEIVAGVASATGTSPVLVGFILGR